MKIKWIIIKRILIAIWYKKTYIRYKTKIYNRKLVDENLQEKYFISRILISLNDKTLFELHTSVYMDKNFTILFEIKKLKENNVLKVTYENIFGQSMSKKFK